MGPAAVKAVASYRPLLQVWGTLPQFPGCGLLMSTAPSHAGNCPLQARLRSHPPPWGWRSAGGAGVQSEAVQRGHPSSTACLTSLQVWFLRALPINSWRKSPSQSLFPGNPIWDTSSTHTCPEVWSLFFLLSGTFYSHPPLPLPLTVSLIPLS